MKDNPLSVFLFFLSPTRSKIRSTLLGLTLCLQTHTQANQHPTLIARLPSNQTPQPGPYFTSSQARVSLTWHLGMRVKRLRSQSYFQATTTNPPYPSKKVVRPIWGRLGRACFLWQSLFFFGGWFLKCCQSMQEMHPLPRGDGLSQSWKSMSECVCLSACIIHVGLQGLFSYWLDCQLFYWWIDKERILCVQIASSNCIFHT